MLRQVVRHAAARLPERLSEGLLKNYRRVLKARGGPFRAHAYYGGTFLCDPYDFIQSRILLTGVWEPDVSSLIESVLKPGDVFADVGANIGYFAVLGAAAVGPEGQVVAVEASPRIFAKLQQHLALNRAENVRAVNVAASDAPGRLRIYAASRHNLGASSTIPSETRTLEAEVDALPLEQILSADERRRLALMKIDVEGGEGPILDHFVETLHLYPERVQLICEFSPKSEADRQRFERLLELGFEAHRIENNYKTSAYLNEAGAAPRLSRIDRLPATISDVLFRRP